ncbi:MAG: magnesium transporter [bacterium]
MANVEAGKWLEQLIAYIESDDAKQLRLLLESLSPSETAWTVSRLSPEHQSKLLTLLPVEDAACVIEDVGDAQGVDMIGDVAPEKAAGILKEMESDGQADLLGGLSKGDAEAILENMPIAEAKELRQLLQYAPDSAGGLMKTEVVSYRDNLTVGEVCDDLSRRGEEFSDYGIQYVFLVTAYQMLVGVLPLRDLLFSSRDRMAVDLMIPNPVHVKVNTPLNELTELFDNYNYLGIPVTDDRGRLIGVVGRSSVQEAIEKRESRSFLRFAGIVGGEELRSMPARTRSARRLSWLSINIVLNLIAASVIAAYEETLTQVIALAFFLPIISDMSGCSGNQAVAVSMRELTKGLLKPKEVLYAIAKEFPIGIMNGIVLGILIGVVAAVWQSNIYLGIVVGVALAANTLVSVCLGGSIPLIMRALKLDPALVSSPVLTTITDMCGFFFVLSFATAGLHLIK